jgi:hypothetical protein
MINPHSATSPSNCATLVHLLIRGSKINRRDSARTSLICSCAAIVSLFLFLLDYDCNVFHAPRLFHRSTMVSLKALCVCV